MRSATSVATPCWPRRARRTASPAPSIVVSSNLTRVDALAGGLDLGFQRVELGDERHEPLLQRADGVELVLRVGHLRAEAVACGLQRLELGAARQLLLELAVDVGAERRCRPLSRASSFSTNGTRAVTREICASSSATDSCRRVAFCVPSSTSVSLAEDGVHLGLELRRARGECRSCVSPNASSAAPVGAELVAQLRGLGVRLVELLHVLAQRIEVLTALLERVHLPRRSSSRDRRPGRAARAALERQLLLRELVGLREQRFEALAETVDFLCQRDRGSCPSPAAPPCAPRRRRPTSAARAAARRTLELLLPMRRATATARARLRAARLRSWSASPLRARPRARAWLAVSHPLVGVLRSASRCGRPSPRPSPPASCLRSAWRSATSIAQTISFTRLAWTTACSTACCWVSSALALLRDVLGKRVERRQALVGALAQLVEPRQRTELASRLP